MVQTEKRINCLRLQGTKIFQYCTCPAGQVTYNFRLSCKHLHLCFKSICNYEHKEVICNTASLSSSSHLKHWSYRTSALGRTTRPFWISLVIRTREIFVHWTMNKMLKVSLSYNIVFVPLLKNSFIYDI